MSRFATYYGLIDGGCMLKEISAEELEAACRKSVRITVTDPAVLVRVLDAMQAEYRMKDDAQIDIYSPIHISKLVMALAEADCEVISLRQMDEELEEYYIELMGGARDA